MTSSPQYLISQLEEEAGCMVHSDALTPTQIPVPFMAPKATSETSADRQSSSCRMELQASKNDP